MVGWSAVIHLAVFLFLLNFSFPARFKEAPVYYVDVLDLPVASPQAGTPGGAPAETKAAPPPPPAPPAPREMTLPSKPTAKVLAKPTATPPKEAEEAANVEKQIENLRQKADAAHVAKALENLGKSGPARGKSGMPGATGTEAGSDYASYLQSRLTDAFRSTIASQSRNPEVVVRLTIGRSGRITRLRMERSTGDKIFEAAVLRAITKAEPAFPPPPKGDEFENGFVFRPQGVGKN